MGCVTIHTMTMFRFFLDTSALIRISRLEGERLEEFKTCFNSKNAELIVTHVAVDEATFRSKLKFRKYKERVDEAVKALRSKGIQVKLESTNVTVLGISRIGFSSLANQDVERIYDELWKEIDACEKAKGRSKDPLNIKRDAVIGVSPLEYSFLVTTDGCLCDSFNEIIEKHRDLIERLRTPEAKIAKRSPEGVAHTILEVFHSISKEH